MEDSDDQSKFFVLKLVKFSVMMTSRIKIQSSLKSKTIQMITPIYLVLGPSVNITDVMGLN